MPAPLARAAGHEFGVTFVTCELAVILFRGPFMHPLARYLDPRRSLASAIGWLVFALSIGLVLVASIWVDDIVRTNVLDQRGRQLDRTADRVEAELNLNIALRLQSVRALAAMLATELRDENRATLRTILENLQRTSPEFEWIGVANPQGRVLAATRGVTDGTSVAEPSWFASGLAGARAGEVRLAPMPTKTLPASARRYARARRTRDRIGDRCQGESGRRHRGAIGHPLAVESRAEIRTGAGNIGRYRSAAPGRE